MADHKLVPIPGLLCHKYRGFMVEWIEHRQDYRVYRPEKPNNTMAYVDTIQEAHEGIDDNYWRFSKEEQ